MKFIQAVRRFLSRVFCCYSLITVAMSVAGSVFNTDEMAKYLSVNQLLSFFSFSLLFALSFGICDLIKKSSVIRRTCQFILTYFSLAAVFSFGGAFENYVTLNAVQNKGFSILAISFMFVIIYVICAAVSLVASAIVRKLDKKDEEYTSIFAEK